MKSLILLILSHLALTALTSCAALGAQGMTPAQIKEFAKDNAATAFCNKTTLTVVETTTSYARTDGGVRQNVNVTEKCGITLTDTTTPK